MAGGVSGPQSVQKLASPESGLDPLHWCQRRSSTEPFLLYPGHKMPRIDCQQHAPVARRNMEATAPDIPQNKESFPEVEFPHL